MFCPNCGNPDQVSESYCRRCGVMIPKMDLAKAQKDAVGEHIKANSFFALLTAVVSLSLAIALYTTFLGEKDTSWLIYLVAGFLTAITAWQIQVFIRTRMLKSQYEKLRRDRVIEESSPNRVNAPNTVELLNPAIHDDIVPPSITEHTTRQLHPRSTKSKH